MSAPTRHRILFHTDPVWFKTGLAQNTKTLMKYLYGTKKYDLGLYCSQGTLESDSMLYTAPWPMYGGIPHDQAWIDNINKDGYKQRNAAYGAYRVDKVIDEFKPTIYLGENDSWAFPAADYNDKPWWKQINSILHITIDSLPIQEDQLKQARNTINYFTWAKFAEDNLHSLGKEYSHVRQIYGCIDTKEFQPISAKEKADLRERFGIAQDALVFIFVFRNQLRKQAVRVLEAFAQFKRETPQSNAKLLFHTSFSERGQGWDIPAQMKNYGIANEDVLCTYVCKKCGNWHVRSYDGEDIDCPNCGAKKSCVTANIRNGVDGMEMRYVYGIADAGISAFSSGGQELHNVQTLLCGLPLACTNYSCGNDFCIDATKDFVTPLSYHWYDEAGTNYLKATTDISSIAAFMRNIYKTSRRDLQAAGEAGLDWARKTFSVETIAKQWESVFDAMPIVDHGSVTISPEKKNDRFEMPSVELSDIDFVSQLYTGVLNLNEPVDGNGHKHWQAKLAEGFPREQVYKYFISVAMDENKKTNAAVTVTLDSLIDDTGKKKLLFVAKESIGDLIVLSSMFKSLKETYPDYDIYVATKPQFATVLKGNSYIYKIITYIPEMENELIMCGTGEHKGYFDAYLNPLVLTQRQLGYLYKKEPVLNIDVTTST